MTSLMAMRRRAMKVATSGPAVSDTFNRADSTTTMGNADTGQPWVPLAGTWGIDANRAYSVDAATDDRQVAVDAANADATVEVDMAVLDAIGGGGLLFRAVDANNYWLFVAEPEIPRWVLYKRVSGTYTLVASFAQAGATGRLLVTASGSAITCKLDGATLMSVTDTAHQTATRHGLRVYRFGSASANRFDNFKVS